MKPQVCPRCYHTYFYAEDIDLSLHCARCHFEVGSIDEGFTYEEQNES